VCFAESAAEAICWCGGQVADPPPPPPQLRILGVTLACLTVKQVPALAKLPKGMIFSSASAPLEPDQVRAGAGPDQAGPDQAGLSAANDPIKTRAAILICVSQSLYHRLISSEESVHTG